MDEFDFNLSRAIDYTNKGEQKKGEILTLKAPNSKQQAPRVKLQQGFFRAIADQKGGSENEQNDADVKIEGAEILALMLSSDVDMVEYHETFRKLMISGVCLVEGEEPLTGTLFDMLSLDDIDSLLGDYLANFILSSVLKTLARK